MVVLELREEKLVTKTIIDRFASRVGSNLVLECFGYIGEHILTIAMSRNKRGVAQAFDYNSGTGEFRELYEKRLVHQEENLSGVVRIGDEFYYSGDGGKIMRLGLRI